MLMRKWTPEKGKKNEQVHCLQCAPVFVLLTKVYQHPSNLLHPLTPLFLHPQGESAMNLSCRLRLQ